jgi:thiol-disulfide isomerase/thioredoxin
MKHKKNNKIINTNEEKKENIIFYITIGITIIGIIIFLLFFNNSSRTEPKDEKNLTSFIECLNQKGAIMYGTEWCGYCRSQKEQFGEYFEKIRYVDCNLEREVCQNAGVKGFPTWVINEKLESGFKTLEQLSKISQCSLK